MLHEEEVPSTEPWREEKGSLGFFERRYCEGDLLMEGDGELLSALCKTTTV